MIYQTKLQVIKICLTCSDMVSVMLLGKQVLCYHFWFLVACDCNRRLSSVLYDMYSYKSLPQFCQEKTLRYNRASHKNQILMKCFLHLAVKLNERCHNLHFV